MIKQFFLCLLLSFLVFSSKLIANPIYSENLIRQPEIGYIRISPDGRYITNYYLNKKGKHLRFTDAATQKLITKLEIGEAHYLKDYQWISNNKIYVLVKNKSQEELHYVVEINGEELKAIEVQLDGYILSSLPNNHEKIMFVKENSSYNNLEEVFIISIEDFTKNDFTKAKKLVDGDSDISTYFYDEDLEKLLAVKHLKNDESLIINQLIEKTKKWLKVILIKDVDYVFTPIALFNKNSLAVLTNKDSDKILLRKFDIKTQRLGDIVYQHPAYDLDSANVSNGKLEYVTYFENGIRKWHYFEDNKEQFVTRLGQIFKNSEYFIIDHSTDEIVSVIYVNASDQPGKYFVYNQNKKQLRDLFSAYPSLENVEFSSSKLIKYKSQDGTELEAFLTRPSGLDHKVLLVMPHGGPIGVKESDQFNKNVQYFSSRGFWVLRVNFRGSSGFGKAFLDKGVGQFGKLIEEDISAAVDIVIQQQDFDHLCSIGSSYGGYSSVMLAIKNPKLYDCVIGAYGIYDLRLLFNISNYRSTEEKRKSIEKVVGKYNDELKIVSPLYLHQQLKAPILLIAGLDDNRADFEHTNRFKYILSKKGHPLETLFYKNTGHGQDTYSGERHELAYSFDYLSRVLNLPTPSVDKMTTEARRALAYDYVLIADGYTYSSKLEHNPSKAFTYYQLAAEYGEPRATFNYAAHYHSDDSKTRDMSKAADLYQKSADRGYVSAHSRLGRMYLEGEYFKRDYGKAESYLKKAYELDDSPINKINLNAFYCLAPGKYKDFNKCIQLFDLEPYQELMSARKIEKAREQIRFVVPRIIAWAKFTAEEYKIVQKEITDYSNINNKDIYLGNVEVGTFTLKKSRFYKTNDIIKVIQKGNKIKVSDENSVYFGIAYSIDVPGLNTRSDQAGVVVNWTITDTDGVKRIMSSHLISGEPGDDWRSLKLLGKEYLTNRMDVEIFDLDQKKIYSESFTFYE